MFSILGRPTRLCDGINRRELLRIGGLGAMGLSLPGLLKATEGPPPGIIDDPTFGRAKNVIYVWLQGGPPQHETFDPKPEAPSEIRGPFQPIQTNIPGVHFSELLPRIARMADKLAVVRSMVTNSNIHSVSGYEVFTGYKYQGPNARQIAPTDWPYFGSMIKLLKPSEELPPLTSVWLPEIMRLNENVTPAGQTAGFIGRQWDADLFRGDPSNAEYHVEGLDLGEVTPLQLKRRASLLEQVQRHFDGLGRGDAVGVYDKFQGQAFDLLTSGRVQKAFEINNEPEHVRARYGNTKWAQCLLLARRLVEVGARLVHVNWTREAGDSAVDNPMWDTHAQNADRLEDVLCPMFDVGFTALLEDLEQRGLLDETLVVAIGEFGRTPKINASGGRDHWGSVFSFALAGAGIQTGQVYGASDRNGAHPARDPVTPADLTATIFHSLGIHHEGTFDDAQRREHRLTTGSPLRALLGDDVATDKRAQPGGSIARVPPYDDTLLPNTDFSAAVPLRPIDFGSRPKGWRATPLAGSRNESALNVQLRQAEASGSGTSTQYAAIGFGLDGEQDPLVVASGSQAMLAQEMRNPRLGRFRFHIQACGQASSKKFFEEAFLANFNCRLVIYRYNDPSKNPGKRKEFISQEFTPAFSTSADPKLQSFEVERLLDSPGPGQNFPIANGYGVAVIVEKTSPGNLELTGNAKRGWAHLRIEQVSLDFTSRTINDQVQV